MRECIKAIMTRKKLRGSLGTNGFRFYIFQLTQAELPTNVGHFFIKVPKSLRGIFSYCYSEYSRTVRQRGGNPFPAYDCLIGVSAHKPWLGEARLVRHRIKSTWPNTTWSLHLLSGGYFISFEPTESDDHRNGRKYYVDMKRKKRKEKKRKKESNMVIRCLSRDFTKMFQV